MREAEEEMGPEVSRSRPLRAEELDCLPGSGSGPALTLPVAGLGHAPDPGTPAEKLLDFAQITVKSNPRASLRPLV